MDYSSFSIPQVKRKKIKKISCLCCCPCRLQLCICRMLNSLLCCSCFLITSTLLVLFSIGIYSFISSNVWNIQYHESVRGRKFDELNELVSRMIDNSKFACTEFTGFSRSISEKFHEGKYHEVIGELYPYTNSLHEKFRGENLCIGLYVYVTGESFNNTYYAFEDCEGEVYLTNTTKTIVIELLKPSDDNYHILNNTYKEVLVEELYQYDDEIYEYYSQEHLEYDIYYEISPWLSFSFGSGQGDLEGIGPDWDEGVSTSVNFWFGIPVDTLSQHFLEITPIHSYTFLVELQREVLVAVSENVLDWKELYDEETETLIHPTDYEGNERVSKIMQYLISSSEEEDSLYSGHLAEVKSGVNRFRVGNDDVMVSYFDKSDVYGEFLLVNAKSIWKKQEVAITSLILSSCIICICFSFCCCCWVCFLVRVYRDASKLVDGMWKANDMKLENLEMGWISKCCAFYEIYYIRNKFQNLVEKLKEYRAFLPETFNTIPGSKKRRNRSVRTNQMIEDDSDSDSDNASSSSHSSRSSHSSHSSKSSKPSSAKKKRGSINEFIGRFSSPKSGPLSPYLHNALFNSNTVGSSPSKSKKFALGCFENDSVCIMISFGTRNNMRRSLDVIYETVLERKRSNMMYDFGFDRITIYINNPNKVVFAANFVHSVDESMVNKGVYDLKYFLCKDTAYFGNLGSSVLKKFCVGGPVEKKLNEMKDSTPENTLLSIASPQTNIKNTGDVVSVYENVQIVRKRRSVDLESPIKNFNDDSDDNNVSDDDGVEIIGLDDENDEQQQQQDEEEEEDEDEIVDAEAMIVTTDLRIFVCERCFSVLEKKFELRMIPKPRNIPSNSFFSDTPQPITMYEMGRSLKVKDDEWMYELDRISKLSRWDSYNKGVEQFEKNELDQSKELFMEFKKQIHPKDDVPTNTWLKRIDERTRK